VYSLFSFQGREKDLVIFCCGRASKERGIGFLEDIRRINVGITRAKSAVLVLYHFEVNMILSTAAIGTLRRSVQFLLTWLFLQSKSSEN